MQKILIKIFNKYIEQEIQNRLNNFESPENKRYCIDCGLEVKQFLSLKNAPPKIIIYRCGCISNKAHESADSFMEQLGLRG